jgi:hypothetical protein
MSLNLSAMVISVVIYHDLVPIYTLNLQKQLIHGFSCTRGRSFEHRIKETSIFSLRDDPIQAEAISASDLGSFDSSKPIKFIIHGYNNQATNKWVINMTQELLKSVCDAFFTFSFYKSSHGI